MSGAGGNATFQPDYQTCTHLSPECPIQATVLGYTPNLGSSIFFAIGFGICLIASIVLCITKRTWTYSIAIILGLILETVGYVGRGLMHNNPWANGPFETQICCIILAPTFICVSVYLTLKHVALHLNPSISRLPPVWYPRIFLPADLSCLIIQAIGGGVASAAGKTHPKLQSSGNHLIVAGVALQVLVLFFFGGMALDYYLRVRKYIHSPEVSPQALAMWRDPKFRKFGMAVGGAFITILTRCVYRVAEMSGGWGNFIMQDEPSFLVLDSSLVLVAVYLLTIFHPGIYFPQMRNDYQKKFAKDSEHQQADTGAVTPTQGEKQADMEDKTGNESSHSSTEAKTEPTA